MRTRLMTALMIALLSLGAVACNDDGATGTDSEVDGQIETDGGDLDTGGEALDDIEPTEAGG